MEVIKRIELTITRLLFFFLLVEQRLGIHRNIKNNISNCNHRVITRGENIICEGISRPLMFVKAYEFSFVYLDHSEGRSVNKNCYCGEVDGERVSCT